VGHNILHQHDENVVRLPDSLCGICHTPETAQRKGKLKNDPRNVTTSET
jgi:hypothetical protein